MQPTGIVTDIQRFSVHDGPGIRTTVFLKGCQMHCAWCHNPETLRAKPELRVDPSVCIGCGACATACSHGARTDGFDRARCAGCGACADVCYAGGLALVGRAMTADAVVAEVLQDRAFFARSGGGVTVSGGEPLLQRAFTRAILAGCKAAGVHTAVESNLAWPWAQVETLLPVTDLVMMDVKLVDDAAHRRWTGVSNAHILANLPRVAAAVPLIVRTPVIVGVNADDATIAAIADRLAALPALEYYELLPYHPLGAGKYETLGYTRDTSLGIPDPALLHRLAHLAHNRGIPVRVLGEML
jgi:pyruvate formate lyase activating enzyme